MGRKKVFALVLAAGMLLTAGCSKKAEDIPEAKPEVTEEVLSDFHDSMEQFRGEEEWNETFSISSGEEEKDIEISADITLPETGDFPVIEGCVPEFNEKFKEKLVRSLLGDAALYLADDAHMIKEDLKERVEELERRVEYYSTLQGFEEESKTEKKKLEKCREYLKSAGDKYTVTADDFKEDHYMGERDGVWYRLDIQGAGDYNYLMNGSQGEICFEIVDLKDAAPQALSGSGDVSISTELQAENVENSCRYSIEEAREMVTGFLKETGFSDLGIQKENSIQWYQDELLGTCGYRFVISPVKVQEILEEDGENPNPGGEILVSDAGIISAILRNPFSVEKISEHIKLLSLNQIKEGIRMEFKNHPDSYFHENDGNDSHKYSELKLVYAAVRNKKQMEKISFLPVWELSHKQWLNDNIYINAIDGSVIFWEDIMNNS